MCFLSQVKQTLQEIHIKLTMGPGQNGHHSADGIFKCIFFYENVCILIYISLKSVPKNVIDNKSALINGLAPNRQ